MNDFDYSDVGNGRRMVAEHGDVLRYVAEWGWLYYDGCAWIKDQTGEVERRAKATVDGMLVAATTLSGDAQKLLARHALRSQSWARIQGMIDSASSELAVVARPKDFDRDPWLLNVTNGTIDLRTGAVRAHERADLLTMRAPIEYEPDGDAPTFSRFVAQIMADKATKVSLLQRALGYSLSGVTTEQKLFMPTGGGGNGKGALMRTIEAAVGPYHRKADIQSFLERRGDGIREDIADLAGARIVSAEEPSKGRALDEGVVKKLTGGDTVSARFLRRDRFTYRPAFKLWLAFNHKPRIRGNDHGIWRRIVLIDFPITFEPDSALEPAMLRELPGVLAWMVQGARDWHEYGLSIPEEVLTDTANYRKEQDGFGSFLEERCELRPDAKEGARPLFEAYTAWATLARIRHPMDLTAFGTELTERNFGKEREGGTGRILRTGLKLRPVNSVNSCEQDSESFRMRARDNGYAGNGSHPSQGFTDDYAETPEGV